MSNDAVLLLCVDLVSWEVWSRKEAKIFEMCLSAQIINSTANTTTDTNVDQRDDDETVINVRIVGLIVLAA